MAAAPGNPAKREVAEVELRPAAEGSVCLDLRAQLKNPFPGGMAPAPRWEVVMPAPSCGQEICAISCLSDATMAAGSTGNPSGGPNAWPVDEMA